MKFQKTMTEEEFNKLSPEEKRVTVAKDVLAMLEAEKLHAETGHILWPSYHPDNSDFSLKEFLQLSTTSCTVCARGALLAGYVGYVNSWTIGQTKGEHFIGSEVSSDYKSLEIFSKEQLALIEVAFEVDSFNYSYRETLDVSHQEVQKSLDFGLEHEDSEDEARDRLEAIMENIIENNGTFIP